MIVTINYDTFHLYFCEWTPSWSYKLTFWNLDSKLFNICNSLIWKLDFAANTGTGLRHTILMLYALTPSFLIYLLTVHYSMMFIDNMSYILEVFFLTVTLLFELVMVIRHVHLVLIRLWDGSGPQFLIQSIMIGGRDKKTFN